MVATVRCCHFSPMTLAASICVCCCSVVPLHSFKTVATLQHVAGASPHQLHPLLIYIDKKAGHGAGGCGVVC